MKHKLLDSGKALLAEIIGNKGASINGIYVTYSTKCLDSAPNATAKYFSAIENSRDRGYARIPVTAVTVKGNTVVFTGLFAANAPTVGADPTESMALDTATLVYMKDDRAANDVFVYSTVLDSPVKVVVGACVTINVSMSIGA